MTEKEQFLGAVEREFPTTMKVLKAFPPAKADMNPQAKWRSAKDLAWAFVVEEKAGEQALDGAIDFGKLPAPPATLQDVITTYEQAHKAFIERVRRTPEAELNKTVKFFVAPQQMGRSEEHTSEVQSRLHLVCRLLLEKKNTNKRPCSTRE